MHKAFSRKDNLLKSDSFTTTLDCDILTFLVYPWACQHNTLVISKKKERKKKPHQILLFKRY